MSLLDCAPPSRTVRFADRRRIPRPFTTLGFCDFDAETVLHYAQPTRSERYTDSILHSGLDDKCIVCVCVHLEKDRNVLE